MIHDFTSSTLATLLVTLDPPGLAPIFVSLTLGMVESERRQVALAGLPHRLRDHDLLRARRRGNVESSRDRFARLSHRGRLAAVLDCVRDGVPGRGERKAETAQNAVTMDRIRDLAAFPLAIPLLAGPGAITAAILLAGRADSDPRLLAILVALIGAVLFCCALVFLVAERVSRLLGITGNVVLTRLLGVILAALAVQFVIDGAIAALTLSREADQGEREHWRRRAQARAIRPAVDRG